MTEASRITFYNKYLIERYTELRKFLSGKSNKLSESEFKQLRTLLNKVKFDEADREMYGAMHNTLTVLTYKTKPGVHLYEQYFAFFKLIDKWHLSFYVSAGVVNKVLRLYDFGVKAVFNSDTLSYDLEYNFQTVTSSRKVQSCEDVANDLETPVKQVRIVTPTSTGFADHDSTQQWADMPVESEQTSATVPLSYADSVKSSLVC
jgi:hypothetical protein